MAKVAALSAASPMLAAMLDSRPSMVGGALPLHKMPSISHLPILQNGDDGEEKEGSEGSKEVKVDGSSSSSSSSESGVSGDDDEDDEEHDELGDPRPVGSEELGF